MIINLASPLYGSIAAGIILMIIAGTYHYIRTLVQLNFTEKKLGNILSEMDSLNAKHKEEIAGIKGASLEHIKNIIKQNQKSTEQLLAKYHRLVPPAKLAFLEEWDNKNMPNKSIQPIATLRLISSLAFTFINGDTYDE
jgi:hypothetical protein